MSFNQALRAFERQEENRRSQAEEWKEFELERDDPTFKELMKRYDEMIGRINLLSRQINGSV